MKPVFLQSPIPAPLKAYTAAAMEGLKSRIPDSVKELAGQLPSVPQAWQNPFQMPELPFAPPVPTLPDWVNPMQPNVFDFNINLEFLTNLGIPPQIVGALTFVIVFPFKIEVVLLATVAPAVYYTVVNTPRLKLTAEIEQRNAELPPLLERLGPLHIESIQSLADAKDISHRLLELNLYAAPSHLEYADSSDLATIEYLPVIRPITQALERALKVRPGQTSPFDRYLLTRIPYRVYRNSRLAIHRWFAKWDEKMGENPRIDKLDNVAGVKNKAVSLMRELTGYDGWKEQLWHRFKAWARNVKWSEDNYDYIGETPKDPEKKKTFATVFSALKQELRDLKQLTIRNLAISFKGKEWIPNYASPELAPENIALQVAHLADLITQRIDTLADQLDGSQQLSPEQQTALINEIQLYMETLYKIDFAWVGQEQQARLIQLESNRLS